MINVQKRNVTTNFHCLRIGLGSANWCLYSDVECFLLYLLASVLGKFEFQYPYSRFVDVFISSGFRPAMSQKKAQTHLSPKKESSFSCCGVSTCLFLQLLCPFRVPLPMFTTSLSSVAFFPMKPDIVTVRSRMFFTRWVAVQVHRSLTVPEIHQLLPCFLTVKHSMRHTKFSTHSFSWNRL